MTRSQRLVLFLITLVLLVVTFYFAMGSALPTHVPPVVMFAALAMLSFTTLFLEHFFTTPTDVVASTLAILLLLAPIHTELSKFGWWYAGFVGYNALLLVMAMAALLLLDETRSAQARTNRASGVLKRISTFIGNGRFLFFVLFVLTLLFYVDSQSKSFLILFGYAAIILLVDHKRLVLQLRRASHGRGLDIGEIIGVQSKNTFLAKLYKDRVPVHRFDFVEFRYSMDEEQRTFRGLIIDNYLLNQEQWIKILATEEVQAAFANDPIGPLGQTDVVFKRPEAQAPQFLDRLVGVVIENSTIETLRFEYGSRVPVSEGDLLEVQIRDTRVLYQIIQGLTNVETLESRNETSFIVGEAIQLGVWNGANRTFERFGWVPPINTPVLRASSIDPPQPEADELQIGTIPGTNYPVLMNVTEAIAHHLAIIGITGSGKSIFTRNLSRQLMQRGNKVIFVDFTGECEEKLADLNPASILEDADSDKVFETINALSTELEKFANQQDKGKIKGFYDVLRDMFTTSLAGFLQSNDQVALFELPDVSNTTGILEYTRWFFKIVFEIAREHKNFGKRVCIVLEEAHTIVPEWAFLGAEDKRATAVVNSISQIALQGRKYGVGFIVVAQRTANVSKTVLTQCNSVIAFQQFDKTGGDFLANYMGSEMVASLPRLKRRQAIAVGKGFRMGIPIIVEVPEIQEP